MPLICYHASHEQFAPSELLALALAAEDAGFGGIHSSDHFHPWSARQGQSGFSLSWIAAALQATTLPFSMVCAPGQRYHPAIVAQAICTLCEMFPGRINFELGSGEAINEKITGEDWPAKEDRNARLMECVQIIRRLMRGEEVNHIGHVKVQHAKLYTLPKHKPELLCAAVSKETCAWAAVWADGLLTTAENNEEETAAKIMAFRSAGGYGKPVYVQYAFSYSTSKEAAINGAYDQWRSNILPREKLATLTTVEEFDRLGEQTSIDELTSAIPIYTSIKELMGKIDQIKELEVDRIILHNVNRMQKKFIEDFKRFNV